MDTQLQLGRCWDDVLGRQCRGVRGPIACSDRARAVHHRPPDWFGRKQLPFQRPFAAFAPRRLLGFLCLSFADKAVAITAPLPVSVPAGQTKTYSVLAAIYTTLDHPTPLVPAAQDFHAAAALPVESRWAAHVAAVDVRAQQRGSILCMSLRSVLCLSLRFYGTDCVVFHCRPLADDRRWPSSQGSR